MTTRPDRAGNVFNLSSIQEEGRIWKDREDRIDVSEFKESQSSLWQSDPERHLWKCPLDAVWGTLTIGSGSYEGRLKYREDRFSDFEEEHGGTLECEAVLRIISTERLVVSGNLNALFSSYGRYKPFKNVISIDLSGWVTEDVTSMNSMFAKCQNLVSLNLSSFNTSKVTDMGHLFEGCANLETLDLRSFNTSQVTDMGGMFYNCRSLTSLDLSGFNTTRVTEMWAMFAGCSKLASLDLRCFDTSQAGNMDCMFAGCWKLTCVDLSGFDTSKVRSMNGF